MKKHKNIMCTYHLPPRPGLEDGASPHPQCSPYLHMGNPPQLSESNSTGLIAPD